MWDYSHHLRGTYYPDAVSFNIRPIDRYIDHVTIETPKGQEYIYVVKYVIAGVSRNRFMLLLLPFETVVDDILKRVTDTVRRTRGFIEFRETPRATDFVDPEMIYNIALFDANFAALLSDDYINGYVSVVKTKTPGEIHKEYFRRRLTGEKHEALSHTV